MKKEKEAAQKDNKEQEKKTTPPPKPVEEKKPSVPAAEPKQDTQKELERIHAPDDSVAKKLDVDRDLPRKYQKFQTLIRNRFWRTWASSSTNATQRC
jgi:hypothetical protein